MRRVRPLLALLACLLVVAVLNGLRPDSLSPARSFDAGPDGWAHAPSASGRVLQVELTNRIVRSTGREVTTQATFVVVRVEVAVRNRVLGLGTVMLKTADGYTYRQLLDLGLESLPLTQAGFTSVGYAAFELPRERVLGATLIISAQSDLLVIYRAELAFPDVADRAAWASFVELSKATTTVTP